MSNLNPLGEENKQTRHSASFLLIPSNELIDGPGRGGNSLNLALPVGGAKILFAISSADVCWDGLNDKFTALWLSRSMIGCTV